MLNLKHFALRSLKTNYFKFNVYGKNYLYTTSAKNKKMSEKIDLKKEFQDMLKETKISDEEAKSKKSEEVAKQKLAMEEAKKDWDEKNLNLKKEWEHKRSNAEEDKDESELNINHMKKKIKSAFFFNKTKNEGKESKGQATDEKESKSKKTEEGEKDKIEPGKISQMYSGFVKVWKQTFPGEENLELLLEKRKQEAQILKLKIKEPTEEEIVAIEAAIPEWKRGAVMLVDDQGAQESYSIFETARRNLTIHVKNLKIYQETQKSLEDSEINLLIDDLKQSYSNVRENIKESQNPFFAVTRDLADRVSFVSPSSQAITVLRKHDPNFDLIEFEKEVKAIFKQLMTACIQDDLDTVKLVAGETALAVLTNDIKSRRERKIECKYKELLYIDNAQYHSANVLDEDNVILRFRISTQEINCKISQKDGKVVEGDVDLVENIQYVIDITRNPEPVVEEVGHPWLVVGLERVGVMRQIV